MARQKKVFKVGECIHVWAQQTQEEGRTPASSGWYSDNTNKRSTQFFEGPRLYSYGYHYLIACFTGITGTAYGVRSGYPEDDQCSTVEGEVVLFNNESSTNTTNRDRWDAYQAVAKFKFVRLWVADPDVRVDEDNAGSHRRNVADFLARWSEQVDKAHKTNNLKTLTNAISKANGIYADLANYVRIFREDIVRCECEDVLPKHNVYTADDEPELFEKLEAALAKQARLQDRLADPAYRAKLDAKNEKARARRARAEFSDTVNGWGIEGVTLNPNQDFADEDHARNLNTLCTCMADTYRKLAEFMVPEHIEDLVTANGYLNTYVGRWMTYIDTFKLPVDTRLVELGKAAIASRTYYKRDSMPSLEADGAMSRAAFEMAFLLGEQQGDVTAAYDSYHSKILAAYEHKDRVKRGVAIDAVNRWRAGGSPERAVMLPNGTYMHTDEVLRCYIQHRAAVDKVSYGNAHTLLRVVKDTVETSRGANVPVEHAKRMWAFVRAAYARAAKVDAIFPVKVDRDSPIRIGHYSLDYIDRDRIVAGCHEISYAELNLIAQELGVPTLDVAAPVEPAEEEIAL